MGRLMQNALTDISYILDRCYTLLSKPGGGLVVSVLDIEFDSRWLQSFFNCILPREDEINEKDARKGLFMGKKTGGLYR